MWREKREMKFTPFLKSSENCFLTNCRKGYLYRIEFVAIFVVYIMHAQNNMVYRIRSKKDSESNKATMIIQGIA